MSIISTPNKVKLFYGNFAINSVAQSGTGNVVTFIDTPHGMAVGDYILATGNTNLPATPVQVTVLVNTTTTIKVNYTSGSGTDFGGTLKKGKELTVYFADDESFEIISKPKDKIDWTTVENIVGYRTLVNIKTEPQTEAELIFWDKFSINDVQTIIVNGTTRNVYLRDDVIQKDLLKGIFNHPIIEAEFVESTITRLTDTTFSGNTNSDGYTITYPTGAKVRLVMNWGSGAVSRYFCVNLGMPYNISVQRKDWNYIDDELGRVTFGFKGSVSIDFGTFGLRQIEADMDDDRTFIKHFVLAPNKTIEVEGVYSIDVVNDFDEVRYSYLGDYIYQKTTQLNFKGKSIQTNQAVLGDTFILDDDTLGILDGEGVLG